MRSLALATALLATPLAAQNFAARSATAWQDLTRTDVDAALALIETNHPGAASELADAAFRARIAQAREKAEGRIPAVNSISSYNAVMNGLANDFRDGHIWSRGLLSPAKKRWSGIVMERAGGTWRVAAHDRLDGEPDLSDARLVACDRKSADELARASVGEFHADPDTEASMASKGYTLLFDEEASFAPPPRTCTFQLADGSSAELTLHWRDVALKTLADRIGKTMASGSAGFGISAYQGGYWIGLERLDERAAEVVQQVGKQLPALRAAPFVVIDLRGNGGGNSRHASDLVGLLVGARRLAAGQRHEPACQGAFWRATPDNAAAIRRFAAGLPAERRPELLAKADEIEVTAAKGQAFAPALPACAAKARPLVPARQTLPPSAMKGRLAFVTDRACFSSCLLAVDMLKAVGALQLGEATDRSTRYMEVREIDLPSGLRTFSTLQKVALGAGDFGPYQPDRLFPGRMADTDALKAWTVANLNSVLTH